MSKRNFLKPGFQFALFTTSYFPLFFLIIIKQIFANYSELKFGGFNLEAITLFVKYFGLSAFLGYFGQTMPSISEILCHFLMLKV